ncbi:MAG: OmpA family protein, partial [Elusimicrobiota bacterium]|nr:OmpA family protein [Elusimicrobiota bacterium]
IKKDIVSFSFSGGAAYLDFSTLTFRNGEIVFVDNAAKDSGGALFASRSKVDFENSLLIFYENKTFDWNGAALSISSGILSVKNSSAAFEENTAAVYGGAVFENEASGLFALSSASFLNNYASYGGGVFLGSSSLVFDKSAVSFASNSAQGGAAASISSSKISFENSNALFSSNTSASDGGSINAENNSLLSFSSSAISFEYNSAGIPGDGSDGNGGGGAVSLINSHFLIKTSSVIFNSNFASNGGSIYAKNSNIEIENSSLSFLNNTAKSMLGSSFYLDRSTLSFKNSNAFFNADFNNAVFGKNSKIILNNAENSQMNFNFNSNRTLPPLAAFADIYLTEYSDMEIAGTDIKIEGGIRLEKSAINASAQNIYISSLSIDRNSSFSLSNSAANQRVIFEELNIDGLFALGLDLNTAHSDYIVSDKTEITSGSVLLIKADFIENAAESRIRIFHGSNFWGAFTTIESILLSGNKGGRLKYDAIYDYNSQTPGIDIDFKGYLFMQDIEGLSDAQKKTAQILDKVNFENNPSMNKEIAKPIFEMMSRGNEEGAIKSLSGVSGEFLANVLSANIVKNNMSRIYPNITNERTLFWSNFLFENAQYPKNLTQNGLGFIFGFNSLNESGNAAGFYISYENEKVSAYNDKAYLDSIGAGAYYAAFKKDISIKTHLGFDLQSFDIRRDIYGLNLKPQSAFYAYTFSAGALFQWDSDIFRFFTDLQYALRLNGEIDEENGSLSNLRIKSKTADNLVLKIGNSFIETKKDRPFEASIRAYIGFNLLGAQQQYDMYFIQAQDFGTIKSKSKEEKLLFLGAIAAIKYNIGKNTALYLNFDANTDTQDSFKFYSSLGFSVSIGAKAKRQNFNQTGIDGAPQTVDLDGILRSFEKKVSQEQGMLNAAQKNKTTTYRVPGTAFEEGDADLSESSLKTLQNLAAQLLAAEYKKIVIEGHTDSSEDTRGLSIRRAKAVFDALSAAGLPENRLDFEGYSDTDPIDNTDSPGGKIKNRRTDIVVTWN